MPLLVLNVVGGAIADKVERRMLMLVGQGIGLLAAIGLAVNAFADRPNLMLIYVLGTLDICAFALAAPAQRSSIIRLIDRSHVASAMALKAISGSVAHVAGPAIGGVLLVRFGVGWTFALDAMSFVVAAGLIAAMRPLPPVHAGDTQWKAWAWPCGPADPVSVTSKRGSLPA